MKCPICDHITKNNICENCGYSFENDLIRNQYLNQLSKQEIDDYNIMIKLQRDLYHRQVRLTSNEEKAIKKILFLARKNEKSGLDTNNQQAIYLYEKAEILGSAEASAALGQIYNNRVIHSESKRDEERLTEKAITHFTIAFARGDLKSALELGKIYMNRSAYKEALYFLEQAIEINLPDVYFQLAQLHQYHSQYIGKKKDLDYIISLYEKAGNLGMGGAFYVIGRIYEYELHNVKKAKENYEKSVKLNYGFAKDALNRLKNKK